MPDACAEGRVKGLKARGSFEIDMTWKGRKLQSAIIKSLNGQDCKVFSSVPLKVIGWLESGTYLVAHIVKYLHYKKLISCLKNDPGYSVPFASMPRSSKLSGNKNGKE